MPFAQVALSFNRGAQPDLNRCRTEAKERTGALAVVLSRGAATGERIPVTDTERLYCFRYSSASTYELLAARRANGGQCPAESEFRTVNNDYVMLILSANPSIRPGLVASSTDQEKVVESRRRCRVLALDPDACGVGR